jgi:hypothetical protein
MALSSPGMENFWSHRGRRNTSSALDGDITETVYLHRVVYRVLLYCLEDQSLEDSS